MIDVNQDAAIYRARVFPLSKRLVFKGHTENIMRRNKASLSTADLIKRLTACV
jgi:hypothetical protein